LFDKRQWWTREWALTSNALLVIFLATSEVNPIAVCLLMVVFTGATHFIATVLPGLLQPHPAQEMDPLSGLGGRSGESQENYDTPPRRLSSSRHSGSSMSTSSFEEEHHDNSARVTTALNSYHEAVYSQGQHKAALAAAERNDGTRNVWDLFEGLWQCASVQRLGKVLGKGSWG
jgi:hypothetical protein